MQNSDRYNISAMCSALGVSRTGFYRHFSHASRRAERKSTICNAILRSWHNSRKTYGSPRIAKDLHEEGLKIAQATVGKYMRELGIHSISHKKPHRKPSKLSAQSHPYIVNRIKDLALTHINQVWTTDITYISTKSGWAYLSTIIDLYSRMPIAMCIDCSMKTDLVVKTFLEAKERRDCARNVILHSDKGSQYRSRMFRSLLEKNGVIQSFTSIGHSCDENAAQESFHATIKKELVNGKVYDDIHDAERDIFSYLQGFFTHKRRHSSLGGLTPFDFERRLVAG